MNQYKSEKGGGPFEGWNRSVGGCWKCHQALIIDNVRNNDDETMKRRTTFE